MSPTSSSMPAGEPAGRESEALLRVRDLTVGFRSDGGADVNVVQEAALDLAAGEVLGVLGESGGGKTTLALALLGLLPPGGRVTRGTALFRGRDLLRLAERQLTRVRGDEISVIFQEPGISLSPCLRAGDQVADVIRVHRGWRRRRCRDEALAMLERVRLEDPGRVYRAYPHQLSGGQRQRVVIAQALACRPAVVIADEPTAALDATTQAEIVALLQDLKLSLGLALLFISHDAALLSTLADRVIVMYAGQVVEAGAREEVYRRPAHPYTRELLRCAPREVRASSSGRGGRRAPLPVIPGAPPDPARWPPGCRFEPRCGDRMEICARHRPELLEIGAERRVRCFKYEE